MGGLAPAVLARTVLARMVLVRTVLVRMVLARMVLARTERVMAARATVMRPALTGARDPLATAARSVSLMCGWGSLVRARKPLMDW